MTVGAANTYTSPLNTHEAYAARRAVEDVATRTSGTAKTFEATSGTKPTNNAVTGTTQNRLSSEVTGYAIQTTQQVNGVESGSTLPVGIQHGLDDIANDPAYAAKRAEMLGRSGDLVFVGKMLPTVNNGFSDAERADFLAKQTVKLATAKQVQGERSAYYESLKSQGMAPADIYAKLMEFNANLPESYNDTVGFSNSGVNMTWSQYHTASHDYLQQAIAKANASETTEKLS